MCVAMESTILPLPVMNVIKQLNIQFKDKREYRNDGKHNKRRHDRRPTEPFNATVIQKKEGIDVTIASIKTNLFKLTEKTYEAVSNEIIILLDTIMEEATEEEQMNVVNGMFDTMSVNKIFASLYSKLYKCCYEKYEIFKIKLSDEIIKYKNNLKTIVFVSANENYEDFCRYNSDNESRKAKTSMFVHMMKEGILSFGEIEELLEYVCDELKGKMKVAGNKEVVEELSENVFILLSLTMTEMKEQNIFGKWKLFVETMSKASVSENKGYSSRSKFKYMDILDIYNGKK